MNRDDLKALVNIYDHDASDKNRKAIENADVSDVKSMESVFYKSEFNGDISKWDVSKVEDMHDMFWSSGFNGDISKWDVSNVENMHWMFWDSKFNGDISDWDISNVEDMGYMFMTNKFNGDISSWTPISLTNYKGMFDDKSKIKQLVEVDWKDALRIGRLSRM